MTQWTITPGVDRNDSSAAVWLDAQTLATRYRVPALTYWDKCVHHFVAQVLCAVWGTDGTLDVSSRSGIQQYPGNLYVASVGTGHDLRLATVVLPVPTSSVEEVVKVFHDQTRDPSFQRALRGHGRFVRIPEGNVPSLWQSRLNVAQQCYDGVQFDWLWVPDNNSMWLPFHQQMKLIMDHNCMNPNVDFRTLLTILTPLIEKASKDLLVEYIYAILAVMYKLPGDVERKSYLAHQRAYLTGLVAVEYSMAEVHTPSRRYEIFQQAMHRVDSLMESLAMEDCPRVYPNEKQLNAGRELGLTESLWLIGTYEYLANFHEHPHLTQIRMSHSSRYMQQINPVWNALEAAVYPTLKMRTMEPEYALYATTTRMRVDETEKGGRQLPGEYFNSLGSVT
ncbi:hypothetical protein DFH08DRAFT_946392 [Mycena albidolilacea]|uniref:Uncharacterized protein n=1 Tax=Mycena albidolilacea TaxID=1033008 RepID=A0AAD7E687_9AGAR|nr:hypothetical protein DFH08DRAFT_946392 [Mycena albidolilacea]